MAGLRFTEEWLVDRLKAQGQVPPAAATPLRAARLVLPRQSEDAEQIALFEWAEYVSVGQRRLADIMFHAPNGGARRPGEAGKLKAMGVKAGVPDVVLPLAAGPYLGGWWELKAGKGAPSDSQLDWHGFLREAGHYVCICWRWQEAATDIVRYLARGTHTVVDRSRLGT